ncbi:unnamed protein product [Pipistrellus nathusii]|uniref:Secreted protein n=1 Tax=Pipistrellus nathusii TaxID=59473 RepID=A0ABN9ZIA7_PIPNA
MKVCKGFLRHGHRFFHLLFKAFSQSFYVFSCFLFLLCLCLRHNQWQSHITGVTGLSYSQLCAQSKNLLRAVCLLPRALVGRIYEEKKKASWESRRNGPFS